MLYHDKTHMNKSLARELSSFEIALNFRMNSGAKEFEYMMIRQIHPKDFKKAVKMKFGDKIKLKPLVLRNLLCEYFFFKVIIVGEKDAK